MTGVLAATDYCAYCPTLCLHACPVATAEANDAVSPWGKMSLARWLANGSAAVTPETAAVLYKCTGCGACTAACRHAVDVGGTLREAREDAIGRGVVAYPPSLFRAPVEAPDDAVLPPGVSGAALYAAGFRSDFLAVARACAARWASRSEVVLASAEDARCVRDIYPLYDVKVRPPVVLAAERARQGPPLEGPVAWHEPCHFVRSPNADHARVRENARRLAGGALVELRWHGDNATCCGGSAVYAATSPNGAREAARRILDNALLKGAKTLLTACEGCARHLGQAVEDRPIRVAFVGGA